jgi:hypothetical protein
MIERFSKEEFENALPVDKKGRALWVSAGIKDNEYAYFMPITDRAGIMIRSSVGKDGLAHETGEDSIRCWLVDSHSGKSVGSKVSRYITRVTGWRKRMIESLRELYRMGLRVKSCPICNQLCGIYKVRKEGKNKGRLFTVCWDHKDWTFQWVDLDKSISEVQVKQPAMTRDVRIAHTCIKYVANYCDGAHKIDNVGFSRFDAEFGAKLASFTVVPGKLHRAAVNLAYKYRNQIPDEMKEELINAITTKAA